MNFHVSDTMFIIGTILVVLFILFGLGKGLLKKHIRAFEPFLTEIKHGHFLNPNLYLQGKYKGRLVEVSMSSSGSSPDWSGIIERNKWGQSLNVRSKIELPTNKKVGILNSNYQFPQVFKDFCIKDSTIFNQINVNTPLSSNRIEQILNDLMTACEMAEKN